MTRRFELLQVDVFSDVPLLGNPLAVLPDARGLESSEMQAIATQMNLSETTFVLPPETPEADYRVRIFTPRTELPFAGHPTLGTAHAMLETGRVSASGAGFTLRQQTLAGVQTIDVCDVEGGREYTMTQPTPSFEKTLVTEEMCAALRVPRQALLAEPLEVSVGIPWRIAALDSLERVRNLDPDMGALAALEKRTGIAHTVFCREAEDPSCSVRVRSFVPGDGIPEDPVCGSGNGCVGAYLAYTGLEEPPFRYRAEQGCEIGRSGRIEVAIESGDQGYVVKVGGRAVTLIEGWLSLPAR